MWEPTCDYTEGKPTSSSAGQSEIIANLSNFVAEHILTSVSLALAVVLQVAGVGERCWMQRR